MPREHYMPKDRTLYARMHKAMFIIQLKLEGQLLARHPEYNMPDRDMLNRINYDDMTITIDGVKHELLDKEFPTVDRNNPNQLTEGEQLLMEHLVNAFENSDKLQKHVRFIYSAGSIYLCYNGNLLFHGCVPLNEDGSYMEFEFGGKKLAGKEFLDYAQGIARDAMFAPEGSEARANGRDLP